MQLHGLHHVTAVTAQVRDNVRFYTGALGLRLVKKSVNQDDVSAYHLFYADKLGSPGTDMTFFDWPQVGPDVAGTDRIAETLFRVNGRAALEYWAERLPGYGATVDGISTRDEFTLLRFSDPEGQALTLVDDGGAPFEGEVSAGAGVPAEFALRGFWGVTLSVPAIARFEPIFTTLMGWEEVAEAAGETLYGMDGGGPGKFVRVVEDAAGTRARLGAGGVHHVAFRVRDEAEQQAWAERLAELGVRHSGPIDRYWFRSVYFRISNGILFELATDGPGFTVDEPLETLGEELVLPPFLEPRRVEIEAGLRPL